MRSLFSKTRLFAFIAVSSLLIAGCAGKRLKLGKTGTGEVVEAEGLVPFVADDLPGTKEGGLAAAQRRALEKVIGVFVAARTRVSKAVTIDQQILSRTEGYVKQYEIVSEGKEDGWWKTKIRALVEFQKLEVDLKELGLMDVAEIGNPRVAILIDESVDDAPAATQNAADGLASALVEAGYTVVERTAEAAAAMKGIRKAVDAGDSKAVKDLGSRLGVEVVILGSAATSRLETGKMLGGFVSYRTRAAAKAVRAETGQVLASESGSASGMDVSAGAAAAKSLKTAGSLLAGELKTKIARVLRTQSDVAVSVAGVKDIDQLDALKKTLHNVAGVTSVQLRRYAGGSALLSMIGAPQAAETALRVLRASASPKVSVLSSSPARIELEILP